MEERRALDKRVLAAFARWKACRETPGRQKTHCHCSLQLLCDDEMCGSRPLSSRSSRSFLLYLLLLPRTLFHAAVSRPSRPHVLARTPAARISSASGGISVLIRVCRSLRGVHSVFGATTSRNGVMHRGVVICILSPNRCRCARLKHERNSDV